MVIFRIYSWRSYGRYIFTILTMIAFFKNHEGRYSLTYLWIFVETEYIGLCSRAHICVTLPLNDDPSSTIVRFSVPLYLNKFNASPSTSFYASNLSLCMSKNVGILSMQKSCFMLPYWDTTFHGGHTSISMVSKGCSMVNTSIQVVLRWFRNFCPKLNTLCDLPAHFQARSGPI